MPLKQRPGITAFRVKSIIIAYDPGSLPDDEQRIPGSDIDWTTTTDTLLSRAWKKLREVFPEMQEALILPEFDRGMTEMRLGFSIAWLEPDAGDVTAQEWSTIDRDLQEVRQRFLTTMNQLGEAWADIVAADDYWSYEPLRH